MEASNYIEEVNVNEDGGIVKKMISAGDEGTKPTKGQEVTVQYEGRLDDGTVFDASTNPGREPLKINIGEGQVIAGWDQGIMAMNLGEKADLVIKSDYAYGDAGSPPKIPGGATLTFTVELLTIDGEVPAKNKLSDEKLLEVALIQKNDGNE
jgi:FKBP-type peptidyl-prolyl cis-trans isomerase